MMAVVFAISLIWLATQGLALVKSAHSARVLYRIQAFGEAILAAGLAISRRDDWLWLSVATIVVLKVGIIPRILRGSLGSADKAYGAQGPLGIASLILIFLALTVGGLFFGRVPGLPYASVIGLLFAAWFIAFIHLSSRYEIWNLIWALLSLDTVSDSAALVFGTSWPETTLLAIDLISLALALTLALLGYRIARTKDTSDVRDLKELIG